MNDDVKKIGAGDTAFDLTRVIPLAPVSTEKLQAAAARLLSIAPIHQARIDPHRRLRVIYDTSLIGIREIESLLDELGIARKSGFWWRMKSAWYSYVDENAQANATAGGGSCCNRPPSVYGGNRESEKLNQWHFHD